jgi:hypothetical protein
MEIRGLEALHRLPDGSSPEFKSSLRALYGDPDVGVHPLVITAIAMPRCHRFTVLGGHESQKFDTGVIGMAKRSVPGHGVARFGNYGTLGALVSASTLFAPVRKRSMNCVTTPKVKTPTIVSC